MHLEHFENDEFRDWADDMSPRLTTLLDVLRYRLGSPVIISPHLDSLGRELDYSDLSQHNINRWGQVLAADFFVAGVFLRYQAQAVTAIMLDLGFTGMGVYTDTTRKGKSQVMFHGDVRSHRSMGDPATWGRVRGVYGSLMQAIQSLPTGGKQ